MLPGHKNSEASLKSFTCWKEHSAFLGRITGCRAGWPDDLSIDSDFIWHNLAPWQQLLTLFYLSRVLFAERARSFLVMPCFTFIQFHIFTPESCPIQPQTSTVGHSAASPQNYSFTCPLFAGSPTGFHSLQISLFQKPSCSHSKLVRQSYIKWEQRLIGPIAHCGFTESLCITTAVPLIGKVSSIRGHD